MQHDNNISALNQTWFFIMDLDQGCFYLLFPISALAEKGNLEFIGMRWLKVAVLAEIMPP
jgi:hypothetical protein